MRLEPIRAGHAMGLTQQVAEDEELLGRTVTLGGRKMTNFASCSYLGLETDPRLTLGAIRATLAYGTQFSASRAFISAPPYNEAETLMSEITGRPSLLVPSTSLGHQAALPVLVGPDDLVLIDLQAHASLHVAATLLRGQGIKVHTVAHNAPDHIVHKLRRSDAPKVWLLVDGIYSMIGDVAPLDALNVLLDEHPRLHLYIDDAHATGWCGARGQGLALQVWPEHPRVLVALSLNKSFACAGGCLALPNAEQAAAVRAFGPAMVFSGPVQPPMLGAIVASAQIHLSDEIGPRQAELRNRIIQFNSGAAALGLPLACNGITPMRYLRLGNMSLTASAALELQAAGFYVAAVAPPAVSTRDVGLRLTITSHHTATDIEAVLDSLATALRRQAGVAVG